MRFWDSSAVVPLLVEEPTSRACRALLRADPRVVVWFSTRTECVSALRRQVRDRTLSEAEARRGEDRLEKHARHWHEVEPLSALRDTAERLVRVHPLAAADALQLAAALAWADQRMRGRQFVVLDATLAAAAGREGFDVIVPA